LSNDCKRKQQPITDPVDALNVEFERLLAKSGWTQSECARQLELTPAVITRYLNGETRPSLTTLKLFKLMLGDVSPLPHAAGADKGSDLRPIEQWERDLLSEMRSLHPDVRTALLSGFKRILNVVPKQAAAKSKKRK
jgi:transcriptional regulator with XRE-family HTH domain